ncbi:hypothetical protein GQ600_1254 [Phytophthora cactorum]|nr:hypothetical protein GQ600_3966 [Phytophthora cactorum]KAF1790359.1 hypothetical protein GQ600_1254 [Phytophthora cactorum]
MYVNAFGAMTFPREEQVKVDGCLIRDGQPRCSSSLAVCRSPLQRSQVVTATAATATGPTRWQLRCRSASAVDTHTAWCW